MQAETERVLRAAGRRSRGAIVAGVRAGDEVVVAAWAPRGVVADGASVLEIGSVTKPLTGILLAEMAARGELALDDRLGDHLPAAAGLGLGDVTLEQLATHRSGLPNVPGGMQRHELALLVGLRAGNPWTGVDRERYHELVRATRRRPPRSGAIRYSSLGFGLLGDALAARAGTSYDALLRERVLAPLGLRRTGLDVPLSLPGASRRGRPRPVQADPMPAAGAVRSTVDDLLRWLEACLAPPEGPLGAALVAAREPRARLGRHGAVGLGWLVTRRRDGEPATVWHNGGTFGFRSFAGFAPGRAAAAAVLGNASRDVTRLGHELLAAAVKSAP